MSKQTNRFQRLVFALNELLGPDAKVEESRELVDSVTGAKREVDVCIETESNGHKLIVGIECRDHSDKQGVPWVEQTLAKHMFLPVNKTVLVSSSGFWATAHTKAQLHNIDLISTAPDESASPFIGGIVNNLEVVFAKRMEYRPETVRVLVQRPSGATEEVVVGVDQGGNAPALHRADGSQVVLQGKVLPEAATLGHLPQLALAQIKSDDPMVRDAVAGESRFDFDGGSNPRLNGELLYLVPDPEHGHANLHKSRTCGCLAASPSTSLKSPSPTATTTEPLTQLGWSSCLMEPSNS